MNRALLQRLFPFLVVGALVVSALGGGQTVRGDAFQDRLFGDRLKRISPEEVSAVVEKHPDDAQLLYAAGSYFSRDIGYEGADRVDRGRALLQKAVSLDKRYEAVALTQELFRAVPGGFAQPKPGPSSATVSRAAEILARLTALDPENALPHWFLADQAFKQDKAEEGFAQIAEALKKRKFETYDSADLQARFHLLDALGRDGILKYSTKAGTVLPYVDIGGYLSERLIERGKQRLSAGDRAGALEDFAAVERLADQLLCARPLFRIDEVIALGMKEQAARARVALYEAEGDAPGAAGARLQAEALKVYRAQTGAAIRENPLGSVFEWMHAGLPRFSEESLQAQLAKSRQFAEAFDKAVAQLRDYTTSPEFERMMDIYLDAVAEESEFAAIQKAGEFYRESSLPQTQEGMAQAIAALYKLVMQLPEAKDRICINNLKQVGLAIFIYANDHDNALPGSLKELAGNYVTDQAILKCPVSGTQYVYVGKGLKLDAKPTTIIAYDDAPVHSGSRHALFVDGHVSTLSEEGLLERLRQQQHPEQPAPGATQ